VYHGEASAVAGAATSIFYFLQALDLERYRPLLLCHLPGNSPGRFGQLGIPLLYHRTPRYMHVQGDYMAPLDFRKWKHLVLSFIPDPWIASIIRQYDVRLVHLHSVVQLSAALTCRLVGVPIVWHVRESLHHGVFGIRRWILESAIKSWPDAIICISEDEAHPFAALPKTHVIYNSVDFSLVDAVLREESGSIRRRLGLDKETGVVGMVGAIDSVKGIYDLVEAAAQVIPQASRPVKFLVVGPSRLTERYEGSRRARLLNSLGLFYVDGRTEMEALIREKNLESHFVFTGAQANALEYMAAMDIVVFPSHLDALGRPALEASALGKPSVATSRNKMTGVVKDGETGILIPPREPGRLAQAILHLLNNPAEMARMGQAGYVYAREHFDSRRNADKIMAIYDEVLANRQKRGLVRASQRNR
jgi:glycosyltransferase involved in cell wall biosynthesis